ncbi:hypothetical protein CHUAL_002681 [Chamberlinius hualienensis]
MEVSAVNGQEKIGDWIKEKALGAGGFGMVMLWKNVNSNQRIAIKQIRWANDPSLTKKHKQRWTQEVDIMKRLNHPNVVAAVDLPEELDSIQISEGWPILSMEYCTGGDLRKILSHPENCCGLKEPDVKAILKQISSALQYLHSMRIIHRDLKPENIVLQLNDGKTSYKLIDLGYAKELEQNSLCTSFVGTLQYLAPELFMTQKYTSSVDYWSFGLVIHECITGKRPFFPYSNPARWIPLVMKKNSEHISANFGPDGNPFYSSHLCDEQHISGPFQQHMEKWLSVMLEWDPQNRGCIHTNGRREVIAFTMLNEIFSKKVVSIFLVDCFQFLYYEISSTTTMEHIIMRTSTDIGCLGHHLLFLSQQGVLCEKQKLVTTFSSPTDEDSIVVFCFNRDKNINFDMNTKGPNIPSMVDKLFRSIHANFCYEEQRQMWEHSVFYLTQVRDIYRRLFQAQNAMTVYLLARNSFIYNATTKMMRELSRLNAKLESFNSSLNLDILKYRKQAQSGGITSTIMYDNWVKNQDVAKEIELLQSSGAELEKSSTVVNTKTIDLQRSPYARNKASRIFVEMHEKCLVLYDAFRRCPKEQRTLPVDNGPMITLLVACIKNKDPLFKDLYMHIRKSLECVDAVQSLISPIELKLREISEQEKQLELFQRDRQIDVWKLIENLCKKIHTMKTTNTNSSISSPSNSSLNTTMSTSSVNQSSMNGHSTLSSIVNKSLQETPSLLYENSQLHRRLQSVQDHLNRTQDEAVSLQYSSDWDFLKSSKD